MIVFILAESRKAYGKWKLFLILALHSLLCFYSEPVVSDLPYQFAKRGSVLNEEALDQLLSVVEKMFLATYTNNDLSFSKKVHKTVNFACANFESEILEKMDKYIDLKPKGQKDFCEKVLLPSFLKHEIELADDDYEQKEYIFSKHSLLFALFKLQLSNKSD